MNHENQDYYQRAYGKIHVSSELQERLMTMNDNHEEKEMRMQQQKRSKRHRCAWRVAAAVLLLAVSLPTGVYAAGKISGYFFKGRAEQNEYQVELSVKKGKEESGSAEGKTTSAPSAKAGPVALTGTSLPGYRFRDEKDGWYDFIPDGGFDSGKEFSMEVIKVDVDVDQGMNIEDVETSRQISVHGQKAVVVHRNNVVGSRYNKKTDYTRRVVVFYEELGYLLHFYAMEGLEEKELLQYVDAIGLKPCGKKKACHYMLLSEYLQYNHSGNEISESKEEVDDRHLYGVGDTLRYDGIEYEIQKVGVTDNVKKYMQGDKKSLRSGIKYWRQLVDKDGTLKPFLRETLEIGDGRKAPGARVTGSEMVNLKFVKMQIRVKNTSKKAQDFYVCQAMSYLWEEDGVHCRYWPDYAWPDAVDVVTMEPYPEYFRESGGGSGFYRKALRPGQEIICHVGYFVDEDMLPHIAICMDYWYDKEKKEPYIDISQ